MTNSDNYVPDRTAAELRREAISAYALEMAGTEFDLDPLLEAAAVEHLNTID